MAAEHPEDRRAARLAAIRAQRGTAEREREIADLESRRRIDPPPRTGEVRTRRTTSAPRPPRRSSGHTAGTSFFGHPWAEWHTMVDTGVAHLVEHAEAAATTTEAELWEHIGRELDLRLGDPTLPMPFLLRDISNRHLEDTGLLLSALVVDDEGRPTPGFFRLAAQVGKLSAAQAPKEGSDATWTVSERQESFWHEQLQGLFAEYGEG